MDYSTCFNCGQQGHFASSCPLGLDFTPPATGNHPPRWRPPARLPAEEQAAINDWGVAACRASLADRA